MNDTPRPKNKRVQAHGYLAAIRSSLTRTKFNFPSYLRILGVFLQHSVGKLRRGSAQGRVEFAGQFLPVSASVAIV
jgi:hypothetical protein